MATSGLAAILGDIGQVAGAISGVSNTGAARVAALPSNLGGLAPATSAAHPFGTPSWGLILALAAAAILLVIILRR